MKRIQEIFIQRRVLNKHQRVDIIDDNPARDKACITNKELNSLLFQSSFAQIHSVIDFGIGLLNSEECSNQSECNGGLIKSIPGS